MDELAYNIEKANENRNYLNTHMEEVVANGNGEPWAEFINVKYGPERPFIIKQLLKNAHSSLEKHRITPKVENVQTIKQSQEKTTKTKEKQQTNVLHTISAEEIKQTIKETAQKAKKELGYFAEMFGLKDSMKKIKSKLPSKKDVIDYLQRVADNARKMQAYNERKAEAERKAAAKRATVVSANKPSTMDR